MDLSQICSTAASQDNPISTTFPTTIGTTESSNHTPNVKPSSLDFILLPQIQETTTEQPSTLTELVFNQCSKLCESIWQLKLHHKSISEEEREVMIDNLSKSAQSLFNTMRSSDDWVSKDKNSKRRDGAHSPAQGKYDEETVADYEEDEEGDYNYKQSTSEGTSNHKDHAEYDLIRQGRNLQDTKSKPNYRRRNRRNMAGMKCHSCGTSSTPEWRRGPDGARTLCNACGLHYSKLLKKGSIAVQTKNYLLIGGTPAVSPSIVSATSIINNNRSITNTPSPMINFPFVLMDPKYGMEKSKFSSSSGRTNQGSNATTSTTVPNSSISSSNNKADSKSYNTQQQKPLFFKQPLTSTPTSIDSPSSSQHQFVNISSPQLPLPPPPLSQQNGLFSMTSNNNNGDKQSNNSSNNNSANSKQNNITPLRIYQWKNS